MRKRKIESIIVKIVLSIKYSRLKDEVKYAEAKKLDALSKKKLLGFSGKSFDTIIADAKKAIAEIEDNCRPASYLLMENGGLDAMLKKLSKSKNYTLVKYNIAFEVVMDEYDYKNNAEFLEKVSFILFKDNSIFQKIEENYKSVADHIYGKKLGTFLENVAKTAAKALVALPVPMIVYIKKSGKAPKVLIGIAGALGAGLFFAHLKQKKQVRKMSSLSAGIFAKMLVISALNLLYAKQMLETKLEFNNYFKSVLFNVNQNRMLVMKAFENQFAPETNQHKITLLHNFDTFVIEQILKLKKG